ncbi:MAG: metallophosphoesterase [Firmicutes bacterium]|nr:metallophosphoesterase [Bacillota bacterium]
MFGLKYKHIFLIITLVASLSGLPGVPFFSDISLATAYPEKITITPADDPQTSLTITWQMDCDTECCHVQYSEITNEHSTPYDVRTITAVPKKLSATAGSIQTYSVTITKLKPGTGYFYRVGCGNTWSEWSTFTTASE